MRSPTGEKERTTEMATAEEPSISYRILRALRGSVQALYRHRRILVTTTRVELRKRYAGSVLGRAWIVLQPTLFLAIYLFVYLVVFRVRFPGYSELDYVIYVFAGLVPYIAFMETLGMATVSIKQNIHLVRNVMLPPDLVPARVVCMALVTQTAGLAIIIVLSGINGTLSVNLLFLPVALLIEAMFLLGLSWAFSAMGVFVPDLGYFVNLMVLLLLFVSPIAFRPEMVPGALRLIVNFNPIYYLTEIFRFSLIDGYGMSPPVLFVAVIGGVMFFALGSIFFRRFRNVLVDYE
ncbi:MAG: ABC transporter permease [Nitrospinota bacterium]|jgi:lipopolysaccharide transport system permease protein|nr:ABC transporter permease [Nitrospinota bacterium]